MQTSDESKIIDILERINMTEIMLQYKTLEKEILENAEMCTVIESYRVAKAAYMESVADRENQQTISQKKDALLIAKENFDAFDKIKDYYRSVRSIELFVDDLNFEIGEILSINKHGSCSK